MGKKDKSDKKGDGAGKSDIVQLPARNVRADVVIVGAGPATLGLLCNAIKTNR